MSRVEFHEEWFGSASQEALAKLLSLTAGTEGKIIEIGSWEGRSTIALANAVHPAEVVAIDTWNGSPGEISADLAAERDVYMQFLHNVHTATRGNVAAFRMGWREYFAKYADPIRFLFIDAEHSYEEVRDNIAAAKPLMAPGSIMCGDDVHHPPVQQAVIEQFGDAQLMATLWWVQL